MTGSGLVLATRNQANLAGHSTSSCNRAGTDPENRDVRTRRRAFAQVTGVGVAPTAGTITFNGRDIGDVLVQRGDIGYVRSIGTFLQQFYIYAVEFVESGHQVGMRAKELCTLDHLPDDILARLGERAETLRELR